MEGGEPPQKKDGDGETGEYDNGPGLRVWFWCAGEGKKGEGVRKEGDTTVSEEYVSWSGFT